MGVGMGSAADEETVQIKDLEFELVRPAAVQLSPEMAREYDSGADHRDALSVRTDMHADSSSVFSEAHRDREPKWISTMNSNDAAQARRSKKIKKLLVEGVPSSVRYLVWAHISNSGSKKMANVLRPPMAPEIERDVEQSFPDHPHLRDPKGPLVSVLFAYIAMVPDLRYNRGLPIIAGHLLQSPEEDAFWTFLAMMDSHLRPLFMPTSPQMGIDTGLFVKAVEATDSQLAMRLFTELKVRPQELCGVWFSSVFAGTLPLEHLHRVWDLFLYEGVPFLFRVALVILLKFPLTSNTSPISYLLRPPPEVFSPDPEQFIAQALAVRLKDDDIRKSRAKMEAAVKQQQQRVPRASMSQPTHPHLQLSGRARVS
ncbi:RabGAP/TBC [Ramaria rubella]|nr:RabGAP/TBC [Ramaria rubella]